MLNLEIRYRNNKYRPKYKNCKKNPSCKNKIISEHFLLLNGDAIFDFNLQKIFKEHTTTGKKITFLGCENQLPYGTIGILNNKIINFERNIIFEGVKSRKIKTLLHMSIQAWQ